jgi:hypothetical protein
MNSAVDKTENKGIKTGTAHSQKRWVPMPPKLHNQVNPYLWLK